MRSAAGSCTKLAPGLYRLRVSRGWDPETKRRIIDDRRFRGTERAAKLELARMLSAAGQSAPVRHTTVAAYLEDEYLPSVRARLKPHTVAAYESRVKVHIVPSLGTARLDKLTPRMIDGWTKGMTEREVPQATRHHAYQTLRSALRQALAWGFIEADPTLGSHVPPMPDSNQDVLTIAGINDYLDAFATLGDAELEIVLALGVGGGLRRCEMCGTEWEQVDFDECVVDLSHGRGRHQLGKEVWDGPLKSKSSRRIVDMPPYAMEILQRHRGETGRIIATVPDTLADHFVSVAADMKLPRTTLEALRNAYTSAARELGVDTRSLADNLGHADEKVTNDRYTVKRSAPGKRLAATVQTLRRTFPQSPASRSDGE